MTPLRGFENGRQLHQFVDSRCVVDQEALVEALAAGAIGGAALDVTVPEPLPVDHPDLTPVSHPRPRAEQPQAEGPLNHGLEALGLAARPDDELRRFIGPPLRPTFRELVPEASDDESFAILPGGSVVVTPEDEEWLGAMPSFGANWEF